MEAGKYKISQWQFEAIAGKVIHKCIQGKLTAKEAIEQIEAELMYLNREHC